jgi:hypothetical protein
MPPYLPIRALNRSQNVRIGKQKILSTATSFIDLGDGPTKKEYTYHSTLGAVYPVGGLTNSNSDTVVDYGATVVAGTAANSVRVADPLNTTKTTGTAGELRIRSTGVWVTIPVTDSIAITANATGSTRVDLVVVDNVTGVGTIVVGTTVAPATPAGKTAVATFTVANGGSVLGPITDVRPRP